ncbi:GH25 family lysozyme, partial [Arthrobacter sp. NPDC057259]|uniref:GH25 family lysozyme n=1 Tax=Arthrobacter sp. NPDC057259 TaxID=3346073 RepID=UPI00363518CD
MQAATATGGAQMGKGLSAGKTTSTQGTWTPNFGVLGLDVSEYQPSVDWGQQWAMGARFAYVKATEGNYYTNPIFASQYSGARGAGLLRGAYHFANPAASSGADQARIFVASGGGWSSDGYTMPPVLDFEENPYKGKTINGYYQGNACYDMTPAALTAWAHDFSNTMESLIGRPPVIYTGNYWWQDCVGNPLGFSNNPLWLASYPLSASTGAGPIPASWSTYSIWQYSDAGQFAGDQNVWGGTFDSLQAFATRGTPAAASAAISATTSSSAAALGSKTSDITCGLRDGGCYQNFQNGAIIWSPATGAFSSQNGPVRDSWKA